MASVIPLDTKYYPSDFMVHTSNLGTMAAPILLMYFDKTVVIDSIVLTVPDNPTTTAPDVRIVKVSAATPATHAGVTGQSDVTTAVNCPISAGSYPLTKSWNNLTSTGFAATSSTDARGNVVEAGSYLWYVPSISVTGVTGPASVMTRWRSQF